MARTAQFNLPLLMPSQAQKHVTVNEAIVRLDAVARLRVVSSSLADPPAAASESQAYLVPPGAAGDWSGREGQIAVWSNGGWLYLLPKQGWRAWDEAARTSRFFDGSAWRSDVQAISPGGATTSSVILEFDHVVAAGATNLTYVAIPAGAQVVGVSGRVLQVVTGAGLSGWKLGVPGSVDRYASGLGTASGSYVLGLSGAPVTYYTETRLLLSAEGGPFAAGRVRLAIHLVQLEPPRAG